MTAYVVNEIVVTDPDLFQTYVVQAPATLAPFAGRYLVRSGGSQAIEGEPPGRLVILEFPLWRHPADPRRLLDVAGLCGGRLRASISE